MTGREWVEKNIIEQWDTRKEDEKSRDEQFIRETREKNRLSRFQQAPFQLVFGQRVKVPFVHYKQVEKNRPVAETTSIMPAVVTDWVEENASPDRLVRLNVLLPISHQHGVIQVCYSCRLGQIQI